VNTVCFLMLLCLMDVRVFWVVEGSEFDLNIEGKCELSLTI